MKIYVVMYANHPDYFDYGEWGYDPIEAWTSREDAVKSIENMGLELNKSWSQQHWDAITEKVSPLGSGYVDVTLEHAYIEEIELNETLPTSTD